MLRDEIALAQDLAEITRLNDWLTRLCAAGELDHHVAADLRLCLNEAVTNVLDYGRADPEPLVCTVRLAMTATAAIAEITDNSFAFDPLAQPEAQKITGLDDAHIGGFGVSLIRSTAASVDYARDGKHNRLVIVCGEPGDALAAPNLGT